MKKFLLFVFAAVFISTSGYARHHEEGYHDGGFYDEYHDNGGYDDRGHLVHGRRNHEMQNRSHDTGKRFKLKRGAPSKKRKYTKRQLHEQKMRHMKRRFNKLPPEKRDAALKEIERHHQEMQRIIGNDKRFPEFSGSGMRKAPPPPKAMPQSKPAPAPSPTPTPVANNPVPKRIVKDPMPNPPAPVSAPVLDDMSTDEVSEMPMPEADAGQSIEENQEGQSRNINVKWRYPKKLV